MQSSKGVGNRRMEKWEESAPFVNLHGHLRQCMAKQSEQKEE